MSVVEDRVERIGEVLRRAAVEVLETMFFTSVLDPSEVGEPRVAAAGGVSASVRFSGDRSGSLALTMPEPSGRMIAADFLGMDLGQVTGDQVSPVMCELANMICGAALSQLDLGGDFILDQPEALHLDVEGGVDLLLALEEGPLRITFHLAPRKATQA